MCKKLIKNSQPFGKNVREPQGGSFDPHCILHCWGAWALTGSLYISSRKNNGEEWGQTQKPDKELTVSSDEGLWYRAKRQRGGLHTVNSKQYALQMFVINRRKRRSTIVDILSLPNTHINQKKLDLVSSVLKRDRLAVRWTRTDGCRTFSAALIRRLCGHLSLCLHWRSVRSYVTNTSNSSVTNTSICLSICLSVHVCLSVCLSDCTYDKASYLWQRVNLKTNLRFRKQ